MGRKTSNEVSQETCQAHYKYCFRDKNKWNCSSTYQEGIFICYSQKWYLLFRINC